MAKQRTRGGNRRGNPPPNPKPAAAPIPKIRNYVDLKTVREKRIKYLERQQELRDALTKKNTIAATEDIFGKILVSSDTFDTRDILLCICDHCYQCADLDQMEDALASAGFTTRAGTRATLEVGSTNPKLVVGAKKECKLGVCRGILVRNTWSTGEENENQKPLSESVVDSDPEEEDELDSDFSESGPFIPRC
jgi:hypothetical protein